MPHIGYIRLFRQFLLVAILAIVIPVSLYGADDLVLSTMVISNYNGEDVSCVGSCNGIAIANAAGGIGPYSYSWDDGQTTQVAIGLCAGMYIVTVTDQTPCSISDTVFLFDPSPLILNTTAFEFPGGNNVSCPGASDGQINAAASGGVGGYSYLWSDGQTGPNAVGLPGGLIFVVATDINGCQVIDSVDLLEPAPIHGGLSAVLGISCAGRQDGFISLTMSGGNGSYSYAWDDGPVTPIRSGLDLGFYTVEVTDILGCEFDTTIEIIRVPSLFVVLEDVLYTSCPNSADGAINMSVAGGSPPYNYLWNHGVSTLDVTDLAKDKYYFTVIDSRGCTETHPITVSTKSKLKVSSLKVNPSCNLSDGAIHLNVEGAQGTISYLWDNGAVDASVEAVEAGEYNVIIMDSLCTIPRKYLLDNSGMLSINSTSVPTACNSSTGSVDADPVGGLAPYSWEWSDGQTTQTALTLSSGIYDVRVTDAAGCIALATEKVEDNNSLEVDIDIVLPSFCSANNGSISLTPTAGIAPYSYLWSTTQTLNTIDGIRSGIYLATIEDFAGCIDTVRIAVEDDDDLESIMLSDPSACTEWTGMAQSMVSGGTAPYKYSWSSGDTSGILIGVPLGMSFVYVRDAAGCLDINTVFVDGSFGVQAEADVYGVSCEQTNDGSIDITTLDGAPSFNFLWNTGAETEDITDLNLAEIYNVQIADTAACTVSGPIRVGDGCDILLDAVKDVFQVVEGTIQVLPVTQNDIAPNRSDIYIELILDPAQGTASVSSENTISYTSIGDYNGQDSLLYVLCNGVGTCDTACVLLSVVPEFVIPNAFSPNGDSENDFFEIRGISEYPNNILTVFNRWGSEVFIQSAYTGTWDGTGPSGKQLPEGTYFYSLELNSGSSDNSGDRVGYVVIRR
ncbi:MAG: gliding motility-associated-like protein [Limisphaerales bacterium]|jgi:gliding motility-associated-like protein